MKQETKEMKSVKNKKNRYLRFKGGSDTSLVKCSQRWRGGPT